MTREQKFYSALRDVFVGAKVEGESGYINLMRIKSRYYETGIFPKLQQDINEALKRFPAFRDELFEKLYDFFHRYFSESGSIYFRYTPLHQNVYGKVYTDDKDVMLFWKTHMLYYVKTDRLFKSMEVEVDGQKFFFDASTLEHKKANEKRDIVYSFKEKRKDTLVFEVAYSERGRKTNVDDILRTLRKQGGAINEDTLERAFRVFDKQSEVDYFINKDAKAFLEEQFNLWLYQYVFSGVSEWTETRIKQLQTLQNIAFKIIAFISQFENELVKIWNKPKFVVNSNYVITLDRIAEKEGGVALVEKLIAHKNFKAQVEEWQQLGIVDKSFKKSDVLEKDGKDKGLTKPYQYLPVDTKHFKDVELEILALFDNLDQELDGWLIKSENYQALNSILPKFREKVKCTFIDPPYNTGTDEFIYRDRFQHSSWLSMMMDRCSLARELMRSEAAFFATIDDTEAANFHALLGNVFGIENFVANVIWQKKYTRSNDARWFSDNHDHVLVYGKEKSRLRLLLQPRSEEQKAAYANPDKHPKGSWKATPLHAKSGNTIGFKYKFRNGVAWSPPPGTYPRFSKETLAELDANNEIWFGEKGTSTPARKTFLSEAKEGITPVTIWLHEEVGNTHEANNELKQVGLGGLFPNPKPTRLIKRISELIISANEKGIIFDFFGGSGTTAHTVINLNRDDEGNRKYLLIEIGDWFETVILPRIKKVVFRGEWSDGKPTGGNGSGHFMKYYALEQYEDALRHAKYGEADLFNDPNKDPYHQYVFLRDLKMLEALEVDTKKNKVKVDLGKLYDDIDIAETLST